MKLTTYVIRQRVHLVNHSTEWVDINSTTNENEARKSYEKAIKNAQIFKLDALDLALIKKTEEVLIEGINEQITTENN